MATILYVDDDARIREVLQDSLERMGHEPIGAAGVAEALKVLSQRQVDLVISDFRMPHVSGLEFLEILRREGQEIPFILLTGFGSIDQAVMAIKAGAIDYITKPVRAEQLELSVMQALELIRLRRENEALRQEVLDARGARPLIGGSAAMRRVLQLIDTAASVKATVLIQGESGTGKELVARAIHLGSARRARPFVARNCPAFAEHLLESQLFGHEKGAFTGAIRRTDGAFSLANGGTLLLDEISEMRLELQSKLLRVLQEREFERVGGSEPVKVDVRVIATTNRDLERWAREGRFREDLYYRLDVLHIVVPPLRERIDDLPLLAAHFALRAAEENTRGFERFSPAALALLGSYSWPGNIRELKNEVERAVVTHSAPVLEPWHFERINRLVGGEGGGGAASSPATAPARGGRIALPTLRIDELERLAIEEALQRAGGNRTRAAALLGMSPRTLRYKLNGTPES
ncbi:MAG: sigma-54-dependent transcriptional regulator [Gemmatimonadaceae bacterium]